MYAKVHVMMPPPSRLSGDSMEVSKQVAGQPLNCHPRIHHVCLPASCDGLQGGNSVMADTSAAGTYEPAQLPPGCYPLSSTASSFLSGLLDNLPALLLFTAPSVNSYERLKPNCWSGEHVVLLISHPAYVTECDFLHALSNL